jgi:hypothetical protein
MQAVPSSQGGTNSHGRCVQRLFANLGVALLAGIGALLATVVFLLLYGVVDRVVAAQSDPFIHGSFDRTLYGLMTARWSPREDHAWLGVAIGLIAANSAFIHRTFATRTEAVPTA